MSVNKRKKRIAIGAGIGLGAAAAITLARRPGLRAHLGAKFNTMFSSGNEKALAKLNIKGDIPKQSVQHARRMINDLKRQGYSLKQIKKMKIGVVGSTGSGKSSLARAIEQELGVSRMSLDEFVSYVPFRSGNVDVRKAIRSKGGLKSGTVVEQSQLLHSGDPSQFDVIMKIERPVKDIKQGLLDRGHAAVTRDYVDLSKAQTTVNEAFGTIGGSRRRLSNGLEMVVKPKGGEHSVRMRLDRARELGLDLDKFKNLSQRDQIQSLANKSIQSNQSFRSHISSGAMGQDVTIGGGLALAGGATGAFMKESSRHRIDSIMAQIDRHALEKRAFAGTAAALGSGALVGGTVGALAGGEGNRLGGALTGALTGAGLAYGGKQLIGKATGLGAAAKGSTRAQVIANSGLAKNIKVPDNAVMSQGVVMTGPKGKVLTQDALNKLKVSAGKGDRRALEYLNKQGLIGENAVKTTTLGQHVKHTDDIAAGLAKGNPEAAYDRAIKAGFMSEGEAAKQLQYVNPARLEAYQAQQAAQQEAVRLGQQSAARDYMKAQPVSIETMSPRLAPPVSPTGSVPTGNLPSMSLSPSSMPNVRPSVSASPFNPSPPPPIPSQPGSVSYNIPPTLDALPSQSGQFTQIVGNLARGGSKQTGKATQSTRQLPKLQPFSTNPGSFPTTNPFPTGARTVSPTGASLSLNNPPVSSTYAKLLPQ